MRKGLLFGFLLFVSFAIYLAPAGLLRLAADSLDDVSLLNPAGTVWNGRAQLIVRTMPVGDVSWVFNPAELLSGRLGYRLNFTGPDHGVAGGVALSLRGADVTLSGKVASTLVNRWLAPYNIVLSGDFDLQNIQLTMVGQRLTQTEGTMVWSGGPVRYELSGILSSNSLPELTAYFGPGPSVLAFSTGGQTPLIQAELLDNGFAKVGITKLLTRMLGNPWPGSDPDHAVVLEVEEQVF